jgi:hypothetical protein
MSAETFYSTDGRSRGAWSALTLAAIVWLTVVPKAEAGNPLGSGNSMPGPPPSHVGGVMDRPVPRAAASADMTQFNRLSETATFAGTTGTQTDLPQADGAPGLYTILERPALQQTRPVIYIALPEPMVRRAPARQANSSGRRYCTVNQVVQSAPGACQ